MADSPSIWPSLVSGAFGFIGVLAGLGWNALQAPKIEERLRDNTRTALRTSLWAELASLAKLMNREIDYIKRYDFTWIPLVESFKIYVANLGNLGLLTPTEVEKITLAYYRYQENAGYIARLAARERRKDLDKSAAEPDKPAIDPDKPAIGRHFEFDFAKAEPRTKQDVIDTLAAIASEADDAAKELEKRLSATGWIKSKDKESAAAPPPPSSAPPPSSRA
jgi:hypothetical protein